MEKKKENPWVILIIGAVLLFFGGLTLGSYGQPGGSDSTDVLYSIMWLFSGTILVIVGAVKLVISGK